MRRLSSRKAFRNAARFATSSPQPRRSGIPSARGPVDRKYRHASWRIAYCNTKSNARVQTVYAPGRMPDRDVELAQRCEAYGFTSRQTGARARRFESSLAFALRSASAIWLRAEFPVQRNNSRNGFTPVCGADECAHDSPADLAGQHVIDARIREFVNRVGSTEMS